MAIRLEQLKEIALFGNADTSKLIAIADRAELVKLKSGVVLYRQGDVSDRAYIITKGRMRVFIEGEDGDIVLELVRQGQLLGYATALSGLRRAVNVAAEGPVELIALPAEDIATVMTESS
jgi:CRP/FNR family transcriptional regulator, cyclic AMP receptor protein